MAAQRPDPGLLARVAGAAVLGLVCIAGVGHAVLMAPGAAAAAASVGGPGAAPGAGMTAGEAGAAAGVPRVDLNRASAAELDLLPGIGPTLAARVVAVREARGGFGRLEDLDAVEGIGPATIEALRDLVVVEGE